MSHGFARTGLATAQIPAADSGSGPWVRPGEWMALPVIPVDAQRVHMLVAVLNNGSNYFAMKNIGPYRVDWGDGNGWENVATNAQAEKNLVWDDYASNPTTSQGWRQALITVEPQPGENLTKFDLNIRHSSVSSSYNTGLLDMQISGPQLSTLTLGATSPNQYHGWCQRLGIQGTTALTSAVNMFRSVFTGLIKIEGSDWSSGCTSFAAALNPCSSLREVPSFNLSSCVNTSSMFSACSSLRVAPMLDLTNVANSSSMFASCSNLWDVPEYDLSGTTDTSSMFSGCNSLEELPALDLSAANTTVSMFNNCASLRVVPPLDLTVCTNVQQMFVNNYSLRELTLLNMDSVTNLGSSSNAIFYGCASLESLLLDGLRYGLITLTGNKLQAAALDALYTSLGTAAGSQTVTVTGNPGTSGDTPSIATGKGWTVTGS